MNGRVVWRLDCATQAGQTTYLVVESGGVEPYGLAILSPGGLAVQEHLAASAASAQGWCHRLAEASVHPCHLQELMEDWLCE